MKKLLALTLAAAMSASALPVLASTTEDADGYGFTTVNADGSTTLNFGNNSITKSGGGSIITEGDILRPDNLRTAKDENLTILTLPKIDLNGSGYDKVELAVGSKKSASVSIQVGGVEVAKLDEVNNGDWATYTPHTMDLTTTTASGNVTLNIVGEAVNTYCGNYTYVKFYGSNAPVATQNPDATAAPTVTTAPTPSTTTEPGTLPYLDTSLSFEERAADLVSRMTLEEKVAQLGKDAPAIERLGVSKYGWWKECLHGVARQGAATNFPTPLSLSNTWNRDLVYRVADITSTEARAKNNRYNLSYYTPTINMARDPRWGRNDETYGEDPYLTGQLGGEFVKGMQGDDEKYTKIIATIKHYLANNNEKNRRGGSSVMTEFNLRNYYGKVFQNVTEIEMPGSVMSSYNATTIYRNGKLIQNYVPSAASGYLLTDLLRRNWGFDGYVTTDCGAGEDLAKRVPAYMQGILGSSSEPAGAYIAAAIQAGMDLECNLGGGNFSVTYGADAVNLGYMTEEQLETAIYHLFLQRFRTGEFDDTSAYRDITSSVIETDDHVAAAEEAAEESWVLLKNDNILPLSADTKSVAVVGDLADKLVLGDYAGSPTKNTTPIEGIRNELKDANVSHLGAVSDAERLFNVKSITLVKKDGSTTKLDLTKAKGVSGMTLKDGMFVDVTPKATAYFENVSFVDIARVRVEMAQGSLIGGTLNVAYGKGGPTEAVIASQATADTDTFDVCEGVYTGEDGGNNGVNDLYLSASATVADFSVDAYKAQLDAADVIIAYAGTIPKQDGFPESDSAESNDREDINLPSHQSHVQEIVNKYGNKTIVVMSTVGQINVEPFMNKCKAILWTSYNGQTQGTALGKVLTGEVNPSGKLTTTWYTNVDLNKFTLAGGTDTIGGISGSYTNYDLQPTDKTPGQTYQYYTNTPIYPFGYGLSYTSYEYSNMTADKTDVDANGTIKFSADITNTGTAAGKETVQLYISHPQTDTNMPDRQLKGFEKLALNPGETKTIEFTLNVKDLALYQENAEKMVVTEGEYTAVIGKNAADTTLSKKFNVTGTLASTLKTVKAMPGGISLNGLICEDGSELESQTVIDSKVSAVMSDEAWYDLSKAEVKYTSANTAVAAVNDKGIVSSGTTEGVTTITVSVTIDGVTKTDAFPVVNKLRIKPSAADIDEAKASLKAEYDKLPKAAYSDENLAQLKSIYNAAVKELEAVETKESLPVVLAKAVNDLNSVVMDKLTETYKIESVNPNHVAKGTIDYREGGIPMYSGATGTVTEAAPYSPIALVAKDAEGNVVSDVVWQIKKFDNSKRKVAEINNETGELTVYGNGIIQVTAADIKNLTCAKLMIHVNMQIEGEYADESNGVQLNDSQKGASGGYNVGNTGDAWYEYKSVKLSNLESIVARVAGKNAGGFYISLAKNSNPDQVVAQASVNGTGGWSSWTDYTLTLNEDVLKNAALNGTLDEYGCATVYVQSNGVNLDYFRLNYIENNDDIPYVIENVLNKTESRMKATLKYIGSTLATDVNLFAEVVDATGNVVRSEKITVCGTGEYEITTKAAEGESVRLTVRNAEGKDLSEVFEKIYKVPVDSEIVVYTLNSKDYRVLSGGTDGEAYSANVNGLSGYGSWKVVDSPETYTYYDVNEKSYEYSFTQAWQAGSGGETKRSLYFTPKSECRVTVVFNGAQDRDMYISQNGEKIATGLGCGQTIAFSAEITDLTTPVYVYGGNSNKNLYAIIVEYYGKSEEEPTATPTATAEPTTAPTATAEPTTAPTTAPITGISMSYTDGAVTITSDKEMNGVLVQASYKDRRLTGIKTVPVELSGTEAAKIELTVNSGDKLMLWDSITSMISLTEALSVESASVSDEGEDIALQYTLWGESTMVLTENDVTGETKIWTILPGNQWMNLPIEYFADSDIEFHYGDKFKINALAEYKNRLYAGCDGGLVIVLTECSKCYKLKKAADFDIKEMSIENGIMYISDGDKDAEIAMSDIGGDDIGADEANVLVSGGAVLVDVRSAEEFAQKSVDGSVNIPIDEIEAGLADYSKDTVLIFYCSAGGRSANAVKTAKSMGFVNVYNLGSIDKLI